MNDDDDDDDDELKIYIIYQNKFNFMVLNMLCMTLKLQNYQIRKETLFSKLTKKWKVIN